MSIAVWTMLRLTSKHRRMLAEKLLDAANLGLAALFFGQFASGRPFSPGLAAAGFDWWIVVGLASVVVGRRRM